MKCLFALNSVATTRVFNYLHTLRSIEGGSHEMGSPPPAHRLDHVSLRSSHRAQLQYVATPSSMRHVSDLTVVEIREALASRVRLNVGRTACKPIWQNVGGCHIQQFLPTHDCCTVACIWNEFHCNFCPQTADRF